MKLEKRSHQEIYDYFLLFLGTYEEGSSMVANLLADGKGNCEARAKLMVMLVEEVFGKDVQVKIQVTNIKDPRTGEIIPHVRAMVTDQGLHYILEPPEIKTVSTAQLKHRQTFPPEIFARAYLVNAGNAAYSKEESKLPRENVASISTDTIFTLPHASTVERKNTQQTDVLGTGENSKKDDHDSLHADHLRVLDNPYIARAVVEMATKRSEHRDSHGRIESNHQLKIYLGQVRHITPECVQIMLDEARSKNQYVGLHLGEGASGLDKSSVQALQPFHEALWIKLDCDIDAEVADALSNKAYLHVYAARKISAAAFNVFAKAEFPNGLSIRSREKLRVEDVRQLMENPGGNTSIILI